MSLRKLYPFILAATVAGTIGAMLLAFPQVMGVGYEYVDQALNGGLVVKTMAILCAAKLAVTIISYSSGNAGGIFAPSLYLGAMAGGAVTKDTVMRFLDRNPVEKA